MLLYGICTAPQNRHFFLCLKHNLEAISNTLCRGFKTYLPTSDEEKVTFFFFGTREEKHKNPCRYIYMPTCTKAIYLHKTPYKAALVTTECRHIFLKPQKVHA